jgi:hypothetical protein
MEGIIPMTSSPATIESETPNPQKGSHYDHDSRHMIVAMSVDEATPDHGNNDRTNGGNNDLEMQLRAKRSKPDNYEVMPGVDTEDVGHWDLRMGKMNWTLQDRQLIMAQLKPFNLYRKVKPRVLPVDESNHVDHLSGKHSGLSRVEVKQNDGLVLSRWKR